MEREGQIIMKKRLNDADDPKLAMKLAQHIWANHKYFVLACSQQHYLKIRQYLKPHAFEMEAAYETLKEVVTSYYEVEAIKYPQLGNALYHVAGYFKKYLSDERRQALNNMIQTDSALALKQLEKNTFLYDVTYLKSSTLWERNRLLPFNQNTLPIKHKGVIYQANELTWEEDTVVVEKK